MMIIVVVIIVDIHSLLLFVCEGYVQRILIGIVRDLAAMMVVGIVALGVVVKNIIVIVIAVVVVGRRNCNSNLLRGKLRWNRFLS